MNVTRTPLALNRPAMGPTSVRGIVLRLSVSLLDCLPTSLVMIISISDGIVHARALSHQVRSHIPFRIIVVTGERAIPDT